MSYSTGTFNFNGDVVVSGTVTCTDMTVTNTSFVDMSSAQTITGSKTFTGGITGNLVLYSAAFPSGYIGGTSGSKLTAAQIPYLAGITGNVVDVSSSGQVITAAKTFSGMPTFSGGLVTSNVSLGSTGNIVIGPNNYIVTQDAAGNVTGSLSCVELQYLGNLAGTPVDISTDQTITGQKTFTAQVWMNSGVITTKTLPQISCGQNGAFTTGTTPANGADFYNYVPFGYGGKLILEQAKLTCLWKDSGYSTATNPMIINEYYHVAPCTFTTASSTAAVLILPDPCPQLYGVRIMFIRCGSFQQMLIATYNQRSAFSINSGSTGCSIYLSGVGYVFVTTPSWNKIGFICIPNPDDTTSGYPYVWNQIMYQ